MRGWRIRRRRGRGRRHGRAADEGMQSLDAELQREVQVIDDIMGSTLGTLRRVLRESGGLEDERADYAYEMLERARCLALELRAAAVLAARQER